MKSRTNVKFDKSTFERIRKTIKNMSITRHKRLIDSSYASELPEEVGIALTNRCNLRCKHCFQWNEKGFLNYDTNEQSTDLDINIFKEIILQTEKVQSNLYLWGGEPLVYKDWDELAIILENHPRWSVLCTNGILIDKKIDSLLKISKSLAILISLDGFEADNDAIRGKGVFNKVIKNIELLLALKKKGEYKGEISINCVLNEATAPKMFDFLQYFEQKGVNSVYFCFPWYLPAETAQRMDNFYNGNFSWLKPLNTSQPASWHSYTYHLPPSITKELIPQINKINEKKWNIRVRFQPDLKIEEINDFIMGTEIPGQKKTACLATSTRMNVLASGEVSVCKMFPEFSIGNLKDTSVFDLWHNENFKKCRETISCGLMPICSKCILLYLHGD